MSIALATKGIIGGFMGGAGGDIVYVDVPVCEPDPISSQFGELIFTARDLSPVPSPEPEFGQELKPHRISVVGVLPNKISSYPYPINL